MQFMYQGQWVIAEISEDGLGVELVNQDGEVLWAGPKAELENAYEHQ